MMKTYPAYRASRLSWAGQVPQHWQEKRARFLFRVIDERSEAGAEELLSVSHLTGVTPRSEKNVTMFMAESYEGHKLCKPGDVVINSLWAWMAALGVSRHRGIVSSAYGVYRQRDERNFNSRFLDYLLRTKGYAGEYLCRSKGVWSSRLLLTPFDFFDIPILQPPRAEQDAIVAFLESKQREMDAFIANKQRTIALLQEQKAALINRAVTRGLDPDAPLKPSGVDWLGDVPAGWRLLPFTKYVEESADYRGATPEKKDSGVFLVTAKNVRVGFIDYETSREYVDLNDYSKIMRRGLPKLGDLLLTTEAPLGNAALIDREDIALAQRIIRFRMPKQVFVSEFVLHSVLAGYFQDQLKIRSTGSTAEGIKASKLHQLRILCPPLAEQNQIVFHVGFVLDQANRVADQARREIALMQEYRAALIAEAVTGRIDVRSLPSDRLAALADTVAAAGFYDSNYTGTSTGETPPQTLSIG